MVVRMRHTRGHSSNRRSHHALKNLQISVCSSCGAAVRPHSACDACGNYRGIKVINVEAKLLKHREKAEKTRKEKEGVK